MKYANSRFFFLVLLLFTLLSCSDEYIPTMPRSGTVTVTVGDNFFNPDILLIEHGTTVIWNFQGDHPHTVTDAHNPSSFDSGERTAGSFQVVFTEPDSFSYFCRVHGETGTIQVQ